MLFVILRQEEEDESSDGDLDPNEIKTIENLSKAKEPAVVPNTTVAQSEKAPVKEAPSKNLV